MIHTRCVNISGVSQETVQRLRDTACVERRQRAQRYRRAEDALRCVTADALLRYAAEQALGITSFCVEYTPTGKPRLKGREGFHYNLSHCGDWVVISFGETPNGIDVQQIDLDEGKERIARQFFTQEEQRYIFEDKNLAAPRFFQVWTGKESYLKFLGTGLHRRLDSFSVLSPSVAELLQSRILDGGYYLTVCSTEKHCTFELLDVERLI